MELNDASTNLMAMHPRSSVLFSPAATAAAAATINPLPPPIVPTSLSTSPPRSSSPPPLLLPPSPSPSILPVDDDPSPPMQRRLQPRWKKERYDGIMVGDTVHCLICNSTHKNLASFYCHRETKKHLQNTSSTTPHQSSPPLPLQLGRNERDDGIMINSNTVYCLVCKSTHKSSGSFYCHLKTKKHLGNVILKNTSRQNFNPLPPPIVPTLSSIPPPPPPLPPSPSPSILTVNDNDDSYLLPSMNRRLHPQGNKGRYDGIMIGDAVYCVVCNSTYKNLHSFYSHRGYKMHVRNVILKNTGKPKSSKKQFRESDQQEQEHTSVNKQHSFSDEEILSNYLKSNLISLFSLSNPLLTLAQLRKIF